jgi:hypothetical protein
MRQCPVIVMQRGLNPHSCVEDPVEIFLAFFGPTRPTLDGAEKLRVPIDVIVVPRRCLFSLPVFNLGFCSGGSLLVSALDGLGDVMPKSL